MRACFVYPFAMRLISASTTSVGISIVMVLRVSETSVNSVFILALGFGLQAFGCRELVNGPVPKPSANWCRGQELNLHGLPHWLLRPACLPFHHPGPARTSVFDRRDRDSRVA